MAKKVVMEDAFATMPELPAGFQSYCFRNMDAIPVYYRREGNKADCTCGMCGESYTTKGKPSRGGTVICPKCGNRGRWEWKRITKSEFQIEDMVLIQCTSDKNLVIRMFRAEQWCKQYMPAKIAFTEYKRRFLHLGDTYDFCYEQKYVKGKWEYIWERGKGHNVLSMSNLYPGWKDEIKRSNFIYCNLDEIRGNRRGGDSVVQALTTYANNPAVEMFARAGMEQLVRYLLVKDGKARIVNRRGDSLKKQLRLQDKANINLLIEEKGDVDLLEILAEKERIGAAWNREQIEFLRRSRRCYGGQKRVEHCLMYMSLAKLMNRIQKYISQGDYTYEGTALDHYDDYLSLREELGYDMTNEVYTYPKNLKEKHDQMIRERREKRDKEHADKMKAMYQGIEDQFEKLDKRYSWQDGAYCIRPAHDAKEIVEEGRTLHHCVGGSNYLNKHSKGETAILFLRKLETPDEPYYTIEIKDNTILQWYGYNDKKPEQEIIGPWLDGYVEHLKSKKNVRKAG